MMAGDRCDRPRFGPVVAGIAVHVPACGTSSRSWRGPSMGPSLAGQDCHPAFRLGGIFCARIAGYAGPNIIFGTQAAPDVPNRRQPPGGERWPQLFRLGWYARDYQVDHPVLAYARRTVLLPEPLQHEIEPTKTQGGSAMKKLNRVR